MLSKSVRFLSILAFGAMASGCAAPGGGPVAGTRQSIPIQIDQGGHTETRHIEFGGVAEVNSGQEIKVSAAQAWEALPQVFAELGMEVTHFVPARREIGAPNHRISREYLGRRGSDFVDCGHDPGLMRALADQEAVDLSVITVVEARGDDEALVRTTVTGSARRGSVGAGRANCTSRGLIEAIIARMTESRAVLNIVGEIEGGI